MGNRNISGKDGQVTIQENEAFRNELATLLIKYISVPEDLVRNMPGVMVCQVATIVRVLQSVEMRQDDALAFITDIFEKAWSHESVRQQQIREAIETQKKGKDTSE
jgi:hypothetical protein